MEALNNLQDVHTDLLEKILKEEAKQAKASRVRMVLSFVAIALLLTLVIVLISSVKSIQSEVKTAVDSLTKTATGLDEVASELKAVDFASLESSIHELADSGTTAMNGITDAIVKINALESMAEETLSSAAETLDFVNKVDIDSLNAGIEKLNEILTKLSGFLSLFGNRG
jgi:predicted PurR-regulated permease PerM